MGDIPNFGCIHLLARSTSVMTWERFSVWSCSCDWLWQRWSTSYGVSCWACRRRLSRTFLCCVQLFPGIIMILPPTCCTGMCASSYCAIHAHRIIIGGCLQRHYHPVCFVYPTPTRRSSSQSCTRLQSIGRRRWQMTNCERCLIVYVPLFCLNQLMLMLMLL